jgi:hypothetical protein
LCLSGFNINFLFDSKMQVNVPEGKHFWKRYGQEEYKS